MARPSALRNSTSSRLSRRLHAACQDDFSVWEPLPGQALSQALAPITGESSFRSTQANPSRNAGESSAVMDGSDSSSSKLSRLHPIARRENVAQAPCAIAATETSTPSKSRRFSRLLSKTTKATVEALSETKSQGVYMSEALDSTMEETFSDENTGSNINCQHRASAVGDPGVSASQALSFQLSTTHTSAVSTVRRIDRLHSPPHEKEKRRDNVMEQLALALHAPSKSASSRPSSLRRRNNLQDSEDWPVELCGTSGSSLNKTGPLHLDINVKAVMKDVIKVATSGLRDELSQLKDALHQQRVEMERMKQNTREQFSIALSMLGNIAQGRCVASNLNESPPLDYTRNETLPRITIGSSENGGFSSGRDDGIHKDYIESSIAQSPCIGREERRDDIRIHSNTSTSRDVVGRPRCASDDLQELQIIDPSTTETASKAHECITDDADLNRTTDSGGGVGGFILANGDLQKNSFVESPTVQSSGNAHEQSCEHIQLARKATDAIVGVGSSNPDMQKKDFVESSTTQSMDKAKENCSDDDDVVLELPRRKADSRFVIDGSLIAESDVSREDLIESTTNENGSDDVALCRKSTGSRAVVGSSARADSDVQKKDLIESTAMQSTNKVSRNHTGDVASSRKTDSIFFEASSTSPNIDMHQKAFIESSKTSSIRSDDNASEKNSNDFDFDPQTREPVESSDMQGTHRVLNDSSNDKWQELLEGTFPDGRSSSHLASGSADNHMQKKDFTESSTIRIAKKVDKTSSGVAAVSRNTSIDAQPRESIESSTTQVTNNVKALNDGSADHWQDVLEDSFPDGRSSSHSTSSFADKRNTAKSIEDADLIGTWFYSIGQENGSYKIQFKDGRYFFSEQGTGAQGALVLRTTHSWRSSALAVLEGHIRIGSIRIQLNDAGQLVSQFKEDDESEWQESVYASRKALEISEPSLDPSKVEVVELAKPKEDNGTILSKTPSCDRHQIASQQSALSVQLGSEEEIKQFNASVPDANSHCPDSSTRECGEQHKKRKTREASEPSTSTCTGEVESMSKQRHGSAMTEKEHGCVMQSLSSPLVAVGVGTGATIREDLPVQKDADANCQQRGFRATPSLPSQRAFRTLVVVPSSHADGTFDRLCKSRTTGQVQCRDAHLVSRAVQLDLRPTSHNAHKSLFIAWDSRVVHQGHTHSSHAKGWSPRLHKPKCFEPNGDQVWRPSLDKEGYVVLADILKVEDVQDALKLLLKDLRRLSPELSSLGEVREWHLPPTSAQNDLRVASGLCHGEFAWFLRTRPEVTRVFEQLFGVGIDLMGSVDAVALAPYGMSANSWGKQWLHLDYTPPQGRIWQACIQLFPDTIAEGSEWERIAIMICKAPTSWRSLQAERILLACSVVGAASRATAGVTLGLVHSEKEDHSFFQGRRLLPELADTAINHAALNNDGSLDSSKQFPCLLNLRLMKAKTVAKTFSIEDLRRMVPKHVLEYISPDIQFDLDASKLVLQAVSKATARRGPAGPHRHSKASQRKEAQQAKKEARLRRRRLKLSAMYVVKRRKKYRKHKKREVESFCLHQSVPLWPGQPLHLRHAVKREAAAEESSMPSSRDRSNGKRPRHTSSVEAW